MNDENEDVEYWRRYDDDKQADGVVDVNVARTLLALYLILIVVLLLSDSIFDLFLLLVGGSVSLLC